jgi:hypothetical protein
MENDALIEVEKGENEAITNYKKGHRFKNK